MAISTTYGVVRKAAAALRTLINYPLGIDADGKASPVAIPLRTVLKIKRVVGVLEVLANDAQEQEQEIFAEAGLKEGDRIPPDLAKKVRELNQVEVEVGAETLKVSDLGSTLDNTVNVALAGVFVDLGPFLVDDE